MSSLVFATSNKDKFHTAFLVLKAHGIKLKQLHIEVDEIQGEDTEIIAGDKANKVYQQLKQPVLVNDDSWAIHGLKGFPGPYMKSITQWFTPDDFKRLFNGMTDRSVTLTQLTVFQDKGTQRLFKKEIPGKLLAKATDFPGPSWANVCSVTSDGRSIAEVRNTTPEQLAYEHDTVWHDVAIWLEGRF